MTTSGVRSLVADSADFRTFVRLALKHEPMRDGNICWQFVRLDEQQQSGASRSSASTSFATMSPRS